MSLTNYFQSTKASERCSTPGRGGPGPHKHSRDHQCNNSYINTPRFFNLGETQQLKLHNILFAFVVRVL